MLKILPYKSGSESAKALAQALRVKRIIPNGGYAPRSGVVVLNWGNSHPHFYTARFLNKPEAVAIATDKLLTLRRLQEAGIPIPEFSTDRAVANRWLREGYRVVVRHKLRANSGDGIEIVRPEERWDVPLAPLYTKYTRKSQEYRVHVFQGRIIDLSEKRKRNGTPPSEGLIRSHKHGWVFCREGINPPCSVSEQAIKAVAALGLDFGAVDVICRDGRVWILEINSAPGLEGLTLQRYAQELRKYV